MSDRGARLRELGAQRRRAVALMDRMLASVRRGDDLDALEARAAQRERGAETRRAGVDLALADGVSWRQLAAALGLPVATAHRRYGK
jgi:hypothetical protein